MLCDELLNSDAKTVLNVNVKDLFNDSVILI